MEKQNSINIDIYDKETLFNKFNRNIISDELATYILKSSKQLLISSNTKIVIHQRSELTDEEQEELASGIRKYFSLAMNEKLVYSRFNNNKQLILLFIGIMLIVFSHFLTNLFEFLIPELFLIAGWVAIWEMVDSLLFIDNKNKIEIKIYKQLSTCKIEFK